MKDVKMKGDGNGKGGVLNENVRDELAQKSGKTDTSSREAWNIYLQI